MGTKAFIKFGSSNQVIGMILDGSPNNLRWICQELIQLAIKERCLTKFRKGAVPTIEMVTAKFCEKHSGWLFLDDIRNPEWISFSAKMQLLPIGPTIGILDIYQGDLREAVAPIGNYKFPRSIFS
jgi:hypothetical protein